jgi:hypothetical protein
MSNLPSNLPALLRDVGLTVVEIDGWRGRGRPGSFDPVGALNHHTGSSAKGWSRAKRLAYAKWMFLTGRSDLPAPLCQIALDPEGIVYVGAAGRANHGGKAKASGSVSGGDANTLYIGIEWMLSGTEAIPKVMMDAGVRLNAVLTEEVTKTSVQTVSCHYQTSITGKWDIGDPAGVPFNGKRVLDVGKFRSAVAVERKRLFDPVKRPARTAEYHWFQPGKVGSATSATVLGVRKEFGTLTNRRIDIGSGPTSEGGGIRQRPILSGKAHSTKHAAVVFSAAVGHAPPGRAPKARDEFMRNFAKIKVRFKGGDLNLGQRVVARVTGRRVTGHGVLWLILPRSGWTLVSSKAVDVRGDHKAVLVTMQHKKTGERVTFLVINAMSVSASAKRAAAIFENGLDLDPDIVLGVECADFRAVDVDRRTN